MGITIISSSGYQSCNWPCSGSFCWQKPYSGCNSGFDLVVVLDNLVPRAILRTAFCFPLIAKRCAGDEVVFLNILSFNFVATPRKSLRFTRFIRSYVNCRAVALTNHCQSYTAFLLDVRCSKLPCSIFWQLFVPNDSAFALLSTPVARSCELQGGSGQKQMWKVTNISNLTVGVSIPSAGEQSPF